MNQIQGIFIYGGKIMNILAVDTTTKVASVSLKLKSNEIIEKKAENEVTHSEKLLPIIDEILKSNNCDLQDIDMYAILNGPGSFTGIRIGLATIKAFLMVNDKKAFSISSLEEIAILAYLNLNEKKDKYVLSLIDAKNDRVYYSVYKISYVDGKVATSLIIPEDNDLIENIFSKFNKIPDDSIIVAGNCINLHTELLKDNFTNSNFLEIYPSSKDVINTIEKIYDTSNYIFDTFTLDAHYVRKSQAERIKDEKHSI